MERSILFLTVPAAEHVDLLEIRDYVLESLDLGVLILGPGVKWEVVALPELGEVLITPAPPPLMEPVRLAEPTPSPATPVPPGGLEAGPVFMGAGAKEKRIIYEALILYKQTHGLGCLGTLAACASGLTETMLRAAVRVDKLPMVTWRLIGEALNAQAGKAEAVHGET